MKGTSGCTLFCRGRLSCNDSPAAFMENRAKRLTPADDDGVTGAKAWTHPWSLAKRIAAGVV